MFSIVIALVQSILLPPLHRKPQYKFGQKQILLSTEDRQSQAQEQEAEIIGQVLVPNTEVYEVAMGLHTCKNRN